MTDSLALHGLTISAIPFKGGYLKVFGIDLRFDPPCSDVWHVFTDGSGIHQDNLELALASWAAVLAFRIQLCAAGGLASRARFHVLRSMESWQRCNGPVLGLPTCGLTASMWWNLLVAFRRQTLCVCFLLLALVSDPLLALSRFTSLPLASASVSSGSFRANARKK